MLRHRLLRPFEKKLFVCSKREIAEFPAFIAKTDEPRIQTMPNLLRNKSIRYVAREKINGQSATYFLIRHRHKFLKDAFEFGVCSRNFRLRKPDDSSYWRVAKKYQLETVLRQIIKQYDWVCIQGEIIGPKIQGNKYGVNTEAFYAFNVIKGGRKISCSLAEHELDPFHIPWAPMVHKDYQMPDTVADVLDFATGQSALAPVLREGVVLRNYEHGISFKAVSPRFLLKHDE